MKTITLLGDRVRAHAIVTILNCSIFITALTTLIGNDIIDNR